MEVIDIGLSELEPMSIQFDPTPSPSSSNFGPGIEFLMNDKNLPASMSTNVDLGDLDKLESDLNELSRESKAQSETRTLTGFASNLFNYGAKPAASSVSASLGDQGTDSKLGAATVDGLGSTKTWDGFTKMNDVPGNTPAAPTMTEKEKRRKKRAMLKKLDEWYEKGLLKHSSHFNMDSSFEEVEDEYETVLEEKRRKDSVKLQGWWFMTFINSIEYGNAVFDPFGLNLDGWGEQISEDIDSYEEIFGELYEKYKGGKMAPEISLLLRIGFSAAVINITNKALSTATPGFNDVIRQSPELMKMFSNATVQSMSQQSPSMGFVNQILNPDAAVNNTFGSPPPPVDPKTQPIPQRPGNTRPDIAMGRGTMFQEGGIDIQERSPIQTQTPARPEMRGPQNLDINGLLSGLKTREVDIHQTTDNDSMVSISSLKDSQNTVLPKRAGGGRRKPRSERNTISLDI